MISAEVPARWPAEALRAQAVAARTYAITTSAGGGEGFNAYADTRSQMYRGVQRRVAGHRRRRPRDLAPRRHLRRQAGHDLLLLDLRRAHRERRERLHRRPAAALAEERRRPLRRRLAEPPLGPVQVLARLGDGQAARPRARAPALDQGARAGRLAADRARAARRQRRDEHRRPGRSCAARFGLRDSWMNFTTFSTDLTKPKTPKLAPAPPGSATDPLTGGNGPSIVGARRSWRSSARSAPRTRATGRASSAAAAGAGRTSSTSSSGRAASTARAFPPAAPIACATAG